MILDFYFLTFWHSKSFFGAKKSPYSNLPVVFGPQNGKKHHPWGWQNEVNNHLKIEVEEGYITRDELYIADEVFLTGTAAEITPVREIDNRTIGNGKRGKTTARIQKMFFEIVRGNHTKFKKWLKEVWSLPPDNSISNLPLTCVNFILINMNLSIV